jgi:hypothetical protein
MKMLILSRRTLQRRVVKVLSPPGLEVETAVSTEQCLQFDQVTRCEAVLVVQNAVLQSTKCPIPKERKLADVSKGSFLASSLGNALAEPRFCNGTIWSTMNIQKELNIRNPLSDRPSVVGIKHNSAMQCVNPQCSNELLYLREGTIELLELDSHADDPFRPDEGGFAMRSLPSKFLWLCGECAKTLIVKRWTTSGLVLVLRNQSAAGGHPTLAIRPAIAGLDIPSVKYP